MVGTPVDLCMYLFLFVDACPGDMTSICHWYRTGVSKLWPGGQMQPFAGLYVALRALHPTDMRNYSAH